MFRILTAIFFLNSLNFGADSPRQLATGAAISKGAISTARDRTLGKWQFAGENHGIRFSFQISNECRASDGSLVVRLENTLEYPVTVSFRINDPDWSKTFNRELQTGEKDVMIKFTPDEGLVCHPYLDEIYVEANNAQASKMESDGSLVEENK